MKHVKKIIPKSKDSVKNTDKNEQTENRNAGKTENTSKLSIGKGCVPLG